MIAELHGKLVSKTSEDELTGNFFGTLRYTSFNNILKKILINRIQPRGLAKMIEKINHEEWADYIKFWPYDIEGEFDVVIDFPELVIGVEVKYFSGLSSDDEIDNSNEENFQESCNQLAREARILKKYDNNNKLLIFIARDCYCLEIYNDVTRRNLINRDVNFGYISWQDILIELHKIDVNNNYEEIVKNDLINLLEFKNFDSFKNFLLNKDFNIDTNKYYKFEENKFVDSNSMNIVKAVNVLFKTYENIDKLMWHCQNTAEDNGYKCMTPMPKFLRYKSDADCWAWGLRDFIMLFQRTSDELLDNKWHNGAVYGIQISLYDGDIEGNTPGLYPIKYTYKDIKSWSEGCSPADHWQFDEPSWLEDKFNIEENDEYVVTTPKNEQISQRYRGIISLVYKSFELSEVNIDNIKEIVFGSFNELADYKY